jgi:hypothetical protein
MPDIRHEESRRGVMGQVSGATEVPETQASIAVGGERLWEVFAANEVGVDFGGTVSIDVPASTDMTDLDQSWIEIKGYYHMNEDANKGDVTIEGPSAVGVPPFLAALALNDLTVDFNGTPVLTSQGNSQPWAMIANIITNGTRRDRESNDVTCGYDLDAPFTGSKFEYAQGVRVVLPDPPVAGPLDVNAAGVYNPGGTRRQRYYLVIPKGGLNSLRQFTLMYRLADAGLSSPNWVPPNVSMRIRARRTGWQAMVQGEKTAIALAFPGPGGTQVKQGGFTTSSIQMYVARKQLTASAKESMAAAWLERPMKMTYTRVRTSTQYYAAATANPTIINALGGVLPRSVMILAMPAALINGTGDGDVPPCVLGAPVDATWSNVTLSAGGGRTFPLRPLSITGGYQPSNPPGGPDTTSTYCLGELYSMYRATLKHGDPFLSASDFTNIAPLCLQIGAQTTAWDVLEDATLQFQGTLTGVPFTSQYALMMISFTDALIEIESNGTVKTDW